MTGPELDRVPVWERNCSEAPTRPALASHVRPCGRDRCLSARISRCSAARRTNEGTDCGIGGAEQLVLRAGNLVGALLRPPDWDALVVADFFTTEVWPLADVVRRAPSWSVQTPLTMRTIASSRAVRGKRFRVTSMFRASKNGSATAQWSPFAMPKRGPREDAFLEHHLAVLIGRIVIHVVHNGTARTTFAREWSRRRWKTCADLAEDSNAAGMHIARRAEAAKPPCVLDITFANAGSTNRPFNALKGGLGRQVG